MLKMALLLGHFSLYNGRVETIQALQVKSICLAADHAYPTRISLSTQEKLL
jgi:hypothetical protein